MFQQHKRRLDLLLTTHAVVAATFGALAILLPHVFGVFFGEGWNNSLRYNPDDGQVKTTHVVIRLYGALILGQALIIWQVRSCQDGNLRRGIIRAYFVVFSLTFLVLLRAHLTSSAWHPSNWLNIILFLALALFYGWFHWFNPPPVFEGLDKAMG